MDVRLERVLVDLRRVMAAEDALDDLDRVERAVVEGRPCDGPVERAQAALRRWFPDRGDGVARAVRARCAHAALLRLQETCRTVPRRRSNVEAPLALTNAYVDLELAWGFARALDGARARRLAEGARHALDQEDPVHRSLLLRYSARIADALGEICPSPASRIAQLDDGIDAFLLYKQERMRLSSIVCDPGLVPDPVVHFQTRTVVPGMFTRGRGMVSLRIREAARLLDRDPAEAERLLLAIARELGRPGSHSTTERQSILRDLGHDLLRFPAGVAQRILWEVTPAWAETTDAFNVNSHVCVSAVGFVDALVVALVGESPLRPYEILVDDDGNAAPGAGCHERRISVSSSTPIRR